MENLEIGSRIRVFEITKQAAEFYYREDQQGKLVAEVNNFWFGSDIGVDLTNEMHVGLDQKRIMVKHVATMVITKLKCECCGEKHSELYPCTKCDQMFCHNCQMPYNQFTQIDYDLCKDCGHLDRD